MRSMIDRFLALRVLTEDRREFRQGLLATYVDLCKVFDSVNRDVLWRILGLCGVPPKLIDQISELYSGTESAVRCGSTISDFQLLLEFIRGVYWPPHFSALEWTGFWGVCQREIKLRCIIWECQDL